MKVITYDQLFAMDLDIKRVSKSNPGLAFLLDSRIKAFYEKNKLHFEAMNEGVKRIQKKFIVHNEKDEPIMEGEGENASYRYVPVYTDFKSATHITNRDEIKRLFEETLVKFTRTSIKADI